MMSPRVTKVGDTYVMACFHCGGASRWITPHSLDATIALANHQLSNGRTPNAFDTFVCDHCEVRYQIEKKYRLMAMMGMQ